VTVTAPAAGTWQLGDLTVNRLGFGAMRLGALRLSPGEMDRLQALRSPAQGRRQAAGS